MELFNIISVILTPGYTPGSQSILISTIEGIYCLPGDNAFFYENFEKNIPVGHIYSRADWFKSMDRIRRLADHILPSHDPRIFEKKPATFP